MDKARGAVLHDGVGLGIYMGASGDHVLIPFHAHFNRLDWMLLALLGG